MVKLKIFRLIVQPTETCLEVLKYVNKNIGGVNRIGAAIVVEKINEDEVDEEMLEIFRKKGITRLPALIAPDGKLFIGSKQIIELFEKHLNIDHMEHRLTAQGQEFGDPVEGVEFGNNPDLTELWQRELYAGIDRRGRFIPRKDKEDEEDDGADIERRLANYRRNIPKHRRTTDRAEHDIDPAPRRKTRQYEDNIPSDDDLFDEPAPRRRDARPKTGGGTEDDLDQRMMAAWMDNNPQGD